MDTGTPLTIQVEDPLEEVTIWMTPIKAFLKKGELSDGNVYAIRIKHGVPMSLIIDGLLYKRGYSRPYLRCIAIPNSDSILRELHEGYKACHEGPDR